MIEGADANPEDSAEIARLFGPFPTDAQRRGAPLATDASVVKSESNPISTSLKTTTPVVPGVWSEVATGRWPDGGSYLVRIRMVRS